MTPHDFDYYNSLSYKIVLERSPEGGYVAYLPELPGCITQGDTVEEALTMLEDAKKGWLELAIQEDWEIPEPEQDEDYSGRFIVRVPKSLHRQLVKKAHKENVSLNQLAAYLLSLGIGRPLRLKK